MWAHFSKNQLIVAVICLLSTPIWSCGKWCALLMLIVTIPDFISMVGCYSEVKDKKHKAMQDKIS